LVGRAEAIDLACGLF